MTFASFFSSTRPQRVIPFVTNFDTLREAHLSVSIHSITEKLRARIPHYRPKCSRDSHRPTHRDGAKLVPRRDIHHLLAPCHVLPSGLGPTLDQRNLVPVCSFPAQFSSVFWVPSWSTYQLSCSNRRPAVSPPIINTGTTATATPNAFNEGGRFL